MVPIREIAIQLYMKGRKKVKRKKRLDVKPLDEELAHESIPIEPTEEHIEEIKQQYIEEEANDNKIEVESHGHEEKLQAEDYINESTYKKSHSSERSYSKSEDVGNYAPSLVEELKAKIYDWDHMLPKKGNPMRKEYLKLLT